MKPSQMLIRSLVALAGGVGAMSSALADVRPHAGMMRHPDVSATHVVFQYANDLWVAPRAGGTALPLSSPEGTETYAKFSPDGSEIAFVGNYDGGQDVYIVPTGGGIPRRVTHHPAGEILTDWSGDNRLIFFAGGQAGLGRQTQIFAQSPEGGMAERLAPPYGANGAVSADGKWLAYTPHTIDTRTWKRYRGGMATDVWLLNLESGESRKITDWEGTDSIPMWHKDKVYYLSDAGPEHKLNIWSFDPATGNRAQLTKFSEFDVRWPSVGPGANGEGEIIFQHGRDLHLLNLGSGATAKLEITIPGDRPKIRAQMADVSKNVSAASISPTGKRAVASARGDIWTAPAEHGSPRQITDTDGVYERYPAWSPDGRWIAWMSDATGEYELYVQSADGKGEPRKLTSDATTFKYEPTWSPDSKKIVFPDKTGAIWLTDVESGETKKIDTDPFAWDGASDAMNWSHDSRWIAYEKSGESRQGTSVWVYDVENGEAKQVTSGMFSESTPVFDRNGNWLFFQAARNFNPSYGELDTSFIYAGTMTINALPLRADVKSPYLAKSDEEEPKKDEDKAKDDKKDGEEKKDGDNGDAGEDNGDAEKKDGDNGEKKDAAAKDDGVSGTWSFSMTGPDGAGVAVTLNLTLNADNTVTGGATSAMGDAPITSGTWNPDTKEITLSLTAPDGSPVSLTGTIANDKLTGTLVVEALGLNTPIEAERTSKPGGGDEGDEDKKKDDDKPREKVEIEFDGLEARAIVLPIKAGVFGQMGVNDKGHLLFVRRAPRGQDAPAAIKIFDLKDDKKEEKEVTAAGGFDLSADGKKLLVMRGDSAQIMDASAGATPKNVVTAGMTSEVLPRDEWAQIFMDAWRIQRDFFYEKGLHGVDWEGVRERYRAMLEDCVSREDVGFVIAEMISELNVGHAYYRPGGADEERPKTTGVGMLGCDFELAGEGDAQAYRIAKIYTGGPWDADAKGPLSQPGVDVKEGDFILAVNGRKIDTSKDPWAAFIGTSGRAVTLTVSESPVWDDKARDVVVEPMGGEGGLRFRAWIERNRAYVAEQTDNRVGYIYVPDTGVNGQNELVRQFYGQLDKQALIIDERWNGGGQIPTRFVELLNRPVTNYWARPDGNDWTWPPDAHQGPKVMLINGLAGSGGDAFPFYFKQAGVGKLIGMRTWGGLVGIHGNPDLMDGSGITVPTFGFYEKDGTWGIEGHGVDPDIEVIDDPGLMLEGGDPQLDAAIQHILGEIGRIPYTPPARPQGPDRSGMGLKDEDR